MTRHYLVIHLCLIFPSVIRFIQIIHYSNFCTGTFFGYSRLMLHDFLFKKVHHFFDIDYALMLMKFKSTE
jgi:hypothetical protein